MYGTDWLPEGIWEPTSHLDIHCHGDTLNMSNYKMICGGTDERMEEWNVALQHQRAHQHRKSGY